MGPRTRRTPSPQNLELTCLQIFFIPYIILEIPSQLGLRKYGVRGWLASAVILWGVVMLAMGFVKTPQQLIATRALLGIFEASLFPGAAFLIACWYPRKSMATRNTAFYFTSTAIGGMSSILAWGISQMNGTANMAGWRWIFIIEGIITVVIGVVAYFFLQDFPDKATFLNEHERNIIITRIQRDRGDATPDPLTLHKALKYIIDPKIWLFSIMFAGTTLASYSMAFFLPTILQVRLRRGVETRSLPISDHPSQSSLSSDLKLTYREWASQTCSRRSCTPLRRSGVSFRA